MKRFFLLSLLMIINLASANANNENNNKNNNEKNEKIIQTITNVLTKLQADMKIERISPSPLTDLWQVELAGGRQLYVSVDGKYLIQGNLYEFKANKGLVNLTQKEEQKGIAKIINSVDVAEMIVFAPKKPKAHITVFTDTTCGYCQKLHSEIDEINKLGIEVRYMAFPRGGQGSEGYQELVNVWCAPNKQDAITRAKNRESVAKANLLCKSPVVKHYEIGNLIGVNGTPAIVLEDGTVIPGYRPAAELAEIVLENKKS